MRVSQMRVFNIDSGTTTTSICARIPFAVCWVWRWVYSLALNAMLQMSEWTLSLILALLHTCRVFKVGE